MPASGATRAEFLAVAPEFSTYGPTSTAQAVANASTPGDRFFIRAADQYPGTNIVEFRVAVAGYKWGITNLLLENFQPDVTLFPGVVDTGIFDAALQEMPWFLRLLMPLMRPFLTSETKAAEGITRLATDEQIEPGAYFTGGHVREPAADAQSDATALVWWEALTSLSERA